MRRQSQNLNSLERFVGLVSPRVQPEANRRTSQKPALAAIWSFRCNFCHPSFRRNLRDQPQEASMRTTTEQNKTVIRSFLEAWNNRQP
jgi:hypothetical protein